MGWQSKMSIQWLCFIFNLCKEFFTGFFCQFPCFKPVVMLRFNSQRLPRMEGFETCSTLKSVHDHTVTSDPDCHLTYTYVTES
jgi:hypothetical protein